MATSIPSFSHLSDQELFAEITRLVAREHEATARLIASLMELDARRLYLGEGCSSLFTYCTRVLRLSEHAAYGRIEAARAARRFPIVLDLLADGSVNLTTVCLLAPHLTPDNHRHVLASAQYKCKREVEHIVASLRPQPAVPSIVRKLPTPRPAEVLCTQQTADGVNQDTGTGPLTATPATRPVVMAPLAPELYKIQFTMSREMYDRLRRAQDLLRHTVPTGDPAAIFDRTLTWLVTELERQRCGATTRTRETPHTARHSNAGSSAPPGAGVRSVGFWSITMSCRSPRAAGRRLRISS